MPLEDTGVYMMALPKFILDGGDGFKLTKPDNLSVLGSPRDLLLSYIRLKSPLKPFSPARLTGSVRRLVGSLPATGSDTHTCCERQCSYGTWISDRMLSQLSASSRCQSIALFPCNQIQDDLPTGGVTDYDLALSFSSAEHQDLGAVGHQGYCQSLGFFQPTP